MDEFLSPLPGVARRPPAEQGWAGAPGTACWAGPSPFLLMETLALECSPRASRLCRFASVFIFYFFLFVFALWCFSRRFREVGTQASAMVFGCPEVRPRVLPALVDPKKHIKNHGHGWAKVRRNKKSNAITVERHSLIILFLCMVLFASVLCKLDN